MRRTATFVISFLVAVSLQASEAVWLVQPSDGVPLALPSLSSAVPSPEETLGYPLGERFSHHDAVVRYLHRLAESSERMVLWEYGRTYEDRPLLLMAISSPANIRRLEDLRRQQLERSRDLPSADADAPTATPDLPIFVWLSYGIHGNESSSTEAAMAAAFVLAAAEGEWKERLESVVVLIDPLTNPDGRERYVHFLETSSGRGPDPYAEAAEHNESWPGGRQNHYLIDLNRDWAWVTQQETRHRLREYGRWEPQVYVDFHEMSALSTYFFPPAAEPIHPSIDKTTVEWLEAFGRANAEAFDDAGWVYYVGEKFDLFYPGYGDTYPALRGAVGMTYEMAGGGRAGRAITRPDGSLLTLSDRIARHLTTSLVTVETAVANRTALVSDFVANRHRAASENIRTFLWEADQAEARAAAELLEAHGLQLQRLGQPQTLEVRDLTIGATSRRVFPAGTYALTTAQPLARLAQSLMEQSVPMPPEFLATQRQRLEQNRSTEFYDITAWSIPLAFNLETFVTAGSIRIASAPSIETSSLHGVGRLGFLVRPQGLAGYRLASALL
ncbi:MAG: M14 family zinc carboxypeptidase, partial [Acidobacteriota bacterium]|nr:M14 family zinc carboxypeptidase [Acidobacteriota bacterium]